MIDFREQIFFYVEKKYGIKPDYPLPSAPFFPVLRHQDNQKWFGLIMDVPREKLGLLGESRVDLINVKLGDFSTVEMLITELGFFPGYHISRGNWVSILLDGTVPFFEITKWLDESYFVTASKKEKLKLRPLKEWLVPANPKYYDILHAFDEKKEIDWKQGRGIKKGDTVYMYAASPISAILYKTIVTKTNIPFFYHEGNLVMTELMKLKLVRKYKSDAFPFDKLKNEYNVVSIRGPRGLSEALSEDLKA